MNTPKIETRDPKDLRPHPLVKGMVRWHQACDEWGAFVEDIRENGILHPLQVTEAGVVVDGWTRVLAATALHLAEVPVQIVSEDNAADIILRELTQRRNLTKGQLAYAAFPAVETAFKEHKRKMLEACRAGNAGTVAHSVRDGSAAELAARFGVSLRLFTQAAELHGLWQEHPELRDQFEASIYDSDKPAGLGGVIAGVKSLLEQTKRGSHGGGRPEQVGKQLDLFAQVMRDEVTRWEYWQGFDDRTRNEYWQAVRTQAAKLAPDQCRELADHHKRLASEFAKAATAS